MIDKRRSYYDHGSLRAESTLIDGVPHGVNRRWHPNGVLAEEIPLDHGIIDGTVKQWNERGELLGSCVITKGTGVHRTWHQNGRLWSEVTMIDGKYTGRYRVYWEDGELAGDTYWIRDEKVSESDTSKLVARTQPYLRMLMRLQSPRRRPAQRRDFQERTQGRPSIRLQGSCWRVRACAKL